MSLSQISESIKIFFSLAPEDGELFEKLRKHLSGLKRQGLIDMWYDSAIMAGSNVGNIIQSYIQMADIIVLLISADFFDSERCVEVEMQYALEQHRVRAAHVIPVLLRPSIWQGFSLEQYSPLPPNGKAISIWENLDTALTEVAEGIRRVVDELASRLPGTHKRMKPPQFPLYTLPYRRNPFFTDREDILTKLQRSFTAEQMPQTRIQALYGLTGMGKTLLAVEYACRHQHEYQAVLWLNAASPEGLRANILSLVAQLGIPVRENADEQQHLAVLQQWLQQHDRWLLVLDNLDDFSILDRLIPPYSSGHILMLTHSQATGSFASAVSVTPMTVEEGALLLLRRAKIIPEQGLREAASEEDFSQAMAIAQEFAGYPLALDQAGAYIEETRRTLASYLKLYRERRVALLARRGRLANDHPDPVTTTLSLTFKKIAQINPHAMELLRFLAFLHPDALPDEMILYGAAALTGPLHTLALDPLLLDDAIDTLRRFSLVHRHADSTTLNMHQIVQVVLKKELSKKQQGQLAIQAVRLVNAIFPEVLLATWVECERYLPQAQHCAALLRDYGLTLPEGSLLLERLGFYTYQRGGYSEAETYLTQALHLQEQDQHIDPSDIARTLNSLGLLYQRHARYQEARALHRRALELRERALGPEHPDIAESLHNLAVLYERAGDYHEAEQFYLRVLAQDESVLGADDPETAKTLNNLGMIYYLQGHYAQAEITYQRALALYERSPSPEHPDLTYTLTGLGTLAEQRRDFQQAEELYRRALAMREHALGNEHSETAHSINKLAHIIELRGDYQQAETLYQRALAITEKTLGPEHPDVALFLNNLALLTATQGQYRQAELLYRHALSIYERILGSEHPTFAHVRANLAQLSDKIKSQAEQPPEELS